MTFGVALAALALGACIDVGSDDEDEPELATVSEELYGSVTYDASCTTEHRAVIDESMRMGRAAALTVAFEQCLDQRMNERYRKCNGDPFYSSDLATQKQKLLAITRNLADMAMRCDGTKGNASAGIDQYEHVGAEALAWGGWLRDITPTLGLPLCGTGVTPCRFAAYPWPYSQAAGIVWHEAMHQRGYVHGADDQDNAKINCGYATDPTWHYQVNTAPYIVGQCVEEVIGQSASCAGMASACPGGYAMVAGFGSTTCECVHDPRERGLSFLASSGGRLDEYGKIVEGSWIDGEQYVGASDAIGPNGPHGDVDGDGKDDLLMADAANLSILVREGTRTLLHGRTAWGTWLGGVAWWQLRKDDVIAAVADVDGNGRAELLIKSPTQGLAIVEVSPLNGTLSTMHVVPLGTRMGGWNVGTADVIVGTADFDGDRRADFVIRSAWGLGVIGRTATGVLTSKAMHANGTRIDRWYLVAGDRIVGMGDVDGDSRAELILWDTYSLGLLRLPVGGSALTSLAQPTAGMFLGGWRLGSADVIRGVAPMDGDGNADLLITSGWGWGVLRWNPSAAQLTSADLVPYGTLLPGGWRLGSDNYVQRLGDVSPNGQAEIVVTSPWGLGVLGLNFFSQRFESSMVHPFGSFVSSLHLTSDVQILGIGDYNGDGSDDLLVKR